jgi:hypothetical protein
MPSNRPIKLQLEANAIADTWAPLAPALALEMLHTKFSNLGW